jgi:hypothetical protein
LVRHGRLHDEEEAERRGGGGDEREDEEEKVENVQVVDGGKKRRRMGTREGVKEEPGKDVDGHRKEQKLVANGDVGGAIDTHDLTTSGLSSQAAPPPPQSYPSPSHGDRPSIARNESASSVLDLARPTITRHESGSSVLDLLAMASMRGGGADGFGGSGGRGSASGDSGGGGVDGPRRVSASGTGTSPRESHCADRTTYID